MPNEKQSLPPLPKIRGRCAPQYVEKGTLLNKRFRLDALIGGGGFGQIYRAIDEENGQLVGVKVEPLCVEAGRMVLEQKVLAALMDCPYTPRLYASGSIANYNYIVMELLGRNLNEIRRKQKTKRLPISVVARVGIHIMSGLQALHNIGFLHRDVKPSNMCVGLHDRSYTAILIDFGMTRQFKTGDGSLRRRREYAAFRGTMRYVSVNVHMRKEQCMGDDIVSLYYSLIEMAEGELPWRLLTDPQDIVEEKKRVSFEEMCVYCPPHFKEMYDHAISVNSESVPDYALLTSLMEKCDTSEQVEAEMDRVRHAIST